VSAAFVSKEVARAAGQSCAAAVFGGFCLLALANAAAIALVVPFPAGGASLRIEHHLFDAAETLGIAAVAAVFVGCFVSAVRLPRWALHAISFVAAIVTVNAVIGTYLRLSAVHARNGDFERLVLVNTLVLCGAALASAPVLASHLASRAKLRLLPLLLAITVLVVDDCVLRDDYAGIHGLVAVAAVLLAGPALAPLVMDVTRALTRRRAGRSALVVVAVFSLFGLAVSPPNDVRHELFRQPCAIAPWVLATLVWSPPRTHAPVAARPSPWSADRRSAPPIPPSVPPLASDLVVVLITIDALRADVVSSPANDARFPTLARLKRDGVVFSNASTAGTQTPVSLSTMFSGRYFSEQRWEEFGVGRERYPYPATDTSPRFPELLVAHAVSTENEAGFVFLADRFGVARGFQEETMFGTPESAAPARMLAGALLRRLERSKEGPLFLYTHFAEPHAPYQLGVPSDEFHHYLAAVAVADAQVGRVLRFLEAHFGERWVLIVTSDHGEAFGDHETFEHAKTLYEELLHVPLIVRSPAVRPRRVDARVGLVDLGPTILDLFGVPTPATFNGQSLVPFLEGRSVALSRPLLAEARLKVELTQSDGLKVIEDLRRKVVEVYDLARDPGETENLFDKEPGRADTALASLREFFAARTLRDGGYAPPYKP